MAQRVAVLGILNKRNGIVQNVALHPGQSVRWKDVIVRLRACESDRAVGRGKADRRVRPGRRAASRTRAGARFSGWLYKELPSLNVVEHPVYDVWPKSCEMTYPAGPPAPAAPVELEQPVERAEIGRAPGAAGPSTECAAATAGGATPPSAADNNAT